MPESTPHDSTVDRILSTGVDELLEACRVASRLSVEAGDLLIAERERARKGARTKADANDFVSDADLASEQLVVEGLLAHRPDDGILGEENGERAGRNEYRWVIDPLDGTRNYVDGCGPFAVSIALERKGVPIVGVIRDPVGGLTYSAIRGRGAQCNGEPVRASKRSLLNQSVVGLSLLPNDEGRAAAMVGIQALVAAAGDFRRLGSAVTQLALVSSGALDATVSMGVRRWDVAAGIVIAQEAGAAVFGRSGGAADEHLTVACGAALADELRHCLAKIVDK